MKWLIAVVRHHRAAVTAAATVLLDVAAGLPLLHAVVNALVEATQGLPL